MSDQNGQGLAWCDTVGIVVLVGTFLLVAGLEKAVSNMTNQPMDVGWYWMPWGLAWRLALFAWVPLRVIDFFTGGPQRRASRDVRF